MKRDNIRFSKIAKEVILNYQKQYKQAQNSLQFIADRAGTSYGTIRNILQKGTPISFNMAKGILSRLLGDIGEEEIMRILSSPETGEPHLKQFYSENFDTEIVSQKFEPYFRNRHYFEILTRSFSERGTSRKSITRLFGQFGLKHLEKLLTLGLVVEENGKIYGNSKRDINLSLKTTRKLSKMALEAYQPENPEKDLLIFYGESYETEEFEKIKKILVEAFKNVRKVKPSSKGVHQLAISQFVIDLNKV